MKSGENLKNVKETSNPNEVLFVVPKNNIVQAILV